LNDSPENKEIENIVKEYAKHDKRIKYYKNDKNMGITPSRNKLLDLARGEYIAIFDHDDISLPERLEKEVEYLDKHPHIGVVSAWVQLFGDSDYIYKNPETDTDIKIYLTENCSVAHTAAMIRKSILVDNDIKYEEFYTPAEDYRLWARLIDVTHFYNIQDVLVKYRWDKNNTSNKQAYEMERAREMIALYVGNKYPIFYKAFFKKTQRTIFRLSLFGVIPLLKIKNNKIYLFGFIPVIKIKWK
jgi:glycosyltransferase involved in cell wall biosynthesis